MPGIDTDAANAAKIAMAESLEPLSPRHHQPPNKKARTDGTLAMAGPPAAILL